MPGASKPLKIIIKRRSSLFEPEGVVGGKPEQMPDSDEPTTPSLIRKKKRKRRRTVDKETLYVTSSDLTYSSNIDKISEAEIVAAVQSINYSIDLLISNILDGAKRSKLSYPSPRKHRRDSDIPTKPDSDSTLLQYLLDSCPLSDHSRDLVVDFILHNLILTLVHKYFFKGSQFFGIGSETLHEYLETMLSKLVAGENSDHIAIQRWRSMSVEAVFQMNDGIESQLINQLITELECMLKVVFPLSPTGNRSKRSKSKSKSKSKPKSNPGRVYKSIVHGERQSLMDIIHQARNLSFTIQHKVVSCQLLVTIAFESATSDGDALGTYAFGLQRIRGSESERSVLIKSKVITSAMLQSLY